MSAIVWSQSRCFACDQAKALLAVNGIAFEEHLIGEGYTKQQLLEAVPGARSVPQIFLNGEYIGGLDQLKNKLKGKK